MLHLLQPCPASRSKPSWCWGSFWLQHLFIFCFRSGRILVARPKIGKLACLRGENFLFFWVFPCAIVLVHSRDSSGSEQKQKTFFPHVKHVLDRTLGSLFMVFYLSVLASLLTPFRCNLHPNGLRTVMGYNEVICNGRGEHLHMALLGIIGLLLPISFLAVSTWVVVVVLPQRIREADMQFVQSCSFLLARFRPGAEYFSVLFLVRNLLLAFLPLLSTASGRALGMNLILSLHITLTAYCKPWKLLASTYLELFLGVLLILLITLGTLFVREVDEVSAVVTCITIFLATFLAIFGCMLYGLVKHLHGKSSKKFRYFLCHHKTAAGSVARLLKMELQKRGRPYTTFVDCDDLHDLTKLFWYVGQETSTCLILGTSEVLKRKWCVGEMVTARVHNVPALLLTWPNFVRPNKEFIDNYCKEVPDISDLARFGIGRADVEETLQWISKLESVSMPSSVNSDAWTKYRCPVICS